MSKTVKLIVTFSFLLNIILVGIIVGGIFQQKRHHPFENIPVSQEIKLVFNKTMSQNREKMRVHFKQMKEYKKELRQIIIADEFDRQAYAVQMDKIRTIKNIMATQKAKTLGDTLSELSYEERKEISGHVLNRLSGKRHGRAKNMREGHNYMKYKDNADK